MNENNGPWTEYRTVWPPENAAVRVSTNGPEPGCVALSFYLYPSEMTVHITPAQAVALEHALSNVNRALADDDDDGLAVITDDDREAELIREEREPSGDHE